MITKEELTKILDSVAKSADFKKIQELGALIPGLSNLDELLAHNAQTALDQVKQKTDSSLGSLSASDRDAITALLARSDQESLEIAQKMLEYNFPANVLLFLHLDHVLQSPPEVASKKSKNETAAVDLALLEVNEQVSASLRTILDYNPSLHLVLLSHDAADVATALSIDLVGAAALQRGQASLVYESGLGVYMGPDGKKKDYSATVKQDISQVMERIAIAGATRVSQPDFRDKFYFCSNEFSVGIRVHPYARSLITNMDKEAAHELLKCLAMALADLVKEDVAAVEQHAMNYLLRNNPSLSGIFSSSADERVWDMERVDQFLQSLEFVHLGKRGSIIRPAEVTDVPAAENIVATLGGQYLVVSNGNASNSLPLLKWTAEQSSGIIACGEDASPEVRKLVESRGGIEYAPGNLQELLHIVDAYATMKTLVK